MAAQTGHNVVNSANGGVVCTWCLDSAVNEPTLILQNPVCLKQAGHDFISTPAYFGFECNSCSLVISYSQSLTGWVVPCAGPPALPVLPDPPGPPDPIDHEFGPVGTWVHGYCTKCMVELCPAMDGDGARQCIRCTR